MLSPLQSEVFDLLSEFDNNLDVFQKRPGIHAYYHRNQQMLLAMTAQLSLLLLNIYFQPAVFYSATQNQIPQLYFLRQRPLASLPREWRR